MPWQSTEDQPDECGSAPRVPESDRGLIIDVHLPGLDENPEVFMAGHWQLPAAHTDDLELMSDWLVALNPERNPASVGLVARDLVNGRYRSGREPARPGSVEA